MVFGVSGKFTPSKDCNDVTEAMIHPVFSWPKLCFFQWTKCHKINDEIYTKVYVHFGLFTAGIYIYIRRRCMIANKTNIHKRPKRHRIQYNKWFAFENIDCKHFCKMANRRHILWSLFGTHTYFHSISQLFELIA